MIDVPWQFLKRERRFDEWVISLLMHGRYWLSIKVIIEIGMHPVYEQIVFHPLNQQLGIA